MNENEVSRVIVDSAIDVHRTLGGPGLLESVYQEALVWELSHRGLTVECEKYIPIVYKGNRLGNPLRIDLIFTGLQMVCKSVLQNIQISLRL